MGEIDNSGDNVSYDNCIIHNDDDDDDDAVDNNGDFRSNTRLSRDAAIYTV